MSNCKGCEYCDRPPYKSPCSECLRYKTLTRDDKIRAMSDDELAELLESISPHTDWSWYLNGKTWLGWLKTEQED